MENMDQTLHSTSSNSQKRSNQNPIDDLSLHILRLVRDVRFISTDDLNIIFPIVRNTLQVRLSNLTRDGFLMHPRAQKYLPKTRGRPALIYSLARRGAKLLDNQFEDPDITATNLEHALLVTRVYLAFLSGCIRYPTLQFDQWVREPTDIMPKRYIYDGRKKFLFANQPDALIDLTASGKPFRFFIECETGAVARTRTNLRSQSSSLRKFLYYQSLFALTAQQYPHFRVLTIIREDDLKYLNHLRRVARGVDPKGKGLAVFWFSFASVFDATAAALFEPVWYTAGDVEPRSLL